jgi:hypothetical protein
MTPNPAPNRLPRPRPVRGCSTFERTIGRIPITVIPGGRASSSGPGRVTGWKARRDPGSRSTMRARATRPRLGRRFSSRDAPLPPCTGRGTASITPDLGHPASPIYRLAVQVGPDAKPAQLGLPRQDHRFHVGQSSKRLVSVLTPSATRAGARDPRVPGYEACFSHSGKLAESFTVSPRKCG